MSKIGLLWFIWSQHDSPVESVKWASGMSGMEPNTTSLISRTIIWTMTFCNVHITWIYKYCSNINTWCVDSTIRIKTNECILMPFQQLREIEMVPILSKIHSIIKGVRATIGGIFNIIIGWSVFSMISLVIPTLRELIINQFIDIKWLMIGPTW